MGGHLINLVFSAGLPRRGVWGHGPAPHQGPAAPRLRRGRRQGQEPQGLRQRRRGRGAVCARERARLGEPLPPPISLSLPSLYLPSVPPSVPPHLSPDSPTPVLSRGRREGRWGSGSRRRGSGPRCWARWRSTPGRSSTSGSPRRKEKGKR